MVREYIGARYVPKFMGAYDATQEYEALCVVDNGQGTSYISKVPTPAGTPLTNTTYWTIYGAASGAIINLQNQIDDINNNVIPPITSAVSALNANVDRLVNRKFVFISDSYGARTYGNKTLVEVIAEFAGISSSNYQDLHLNGSGFIGLGGGIDNFETLLTNATITIPADEVTDIIVLGGANDITDTQANIESAIDSFCDYCKSTYPNAKIRLAHVGRFWDKARHSQVPVTSLPAWRNCSAFGASYIANSEYILHKKSLVESDSVHPTSSGVLEIAKQIASVILGAGSCDVHYRTMASLDVQNGALFTNVTKPGTNPIIITVDNETTTMILGSENRILALLASAQIFSTDISINDIATITQTDDCMLFGNILGTVSQGIDVSATGIDGNNAVVGTMPACLYIGSSGNVLFNLQNRFIPNGTSTSYVGVQIYIAGRSYSISSELC